MSDVHHERGTSNLDPTGRASDTFGEGDVRRRIFTRDRSDHVEISTDPELSAENRYRELCKTLGEGVALPDSHLNALARAYGFERARYKTREVVAGVASALLILGTLGIAAFAAGSILPGFVGFIGVVFALVAFAFFPGVRHVLRTPWAVVLCFAIIATLAWTNLVAKHVPHYVLQGTRAGTFALLSYVGGAVCAVLAIEALGKWTDRRADSLEKRASILLALLEAHTWMTTTAAEDVCDYQRTRRVVRINGRVVRRILRIGSLIDARSALSVHVTDTEVVLFRNMSRRSTFAILKDPTDVSGDSMQLLARTSIIDNSVQWKRGILWDRFLVGSKVVRCLLHSPLLRDLRDYVRARAAELSVGGETTLALDRRRDRLIELTNSIAKSLASCLDRTTRMLSGPNRVWFAGKSSQIVMTMRAIQTWIIHPKIDTPGSLREVFRKQAEVVVRGNWDEFPLVKSPAEQPRWIAWTLRGIGVAIIAFGLVGLEPLLAVISFKLSDNVRTVVVLGLTWIGIIIAGQSAPGKADVDLIGQVMQLVPGFGKKAT